MPYRVETRFQIDRWRDMPAFLAAVVREIGNFRDTPGAEAMYLKGKLWKLQAGSYSEWTDEAAMRGYIASQGHRRAADTTQSRWARETWIAFDHQPPAHFQRCSHCGAVSRAARVRSNCQECGRALPSRLGPAPENPRRGIPITPRIPAAGPVRRFTLREHPNHCPVCGNENPPGLAYCGQCKSRTRKVRSLVTRSARWELYIFLGALVITVLTSLFVVATSPSGITFSR